MEVTFLVISIFLWAEIAAKSMAKYICSSSKALCKWQFMQVDDWTSCWAEFDIGKIADNSSRQTRVEGHDHLCP